MFGRTREAFQAIPANGMQMSRAFLLCQVIARAGLSAHAGSVPGTVRPPRVYRPEHARRRDRILRPLSRLPFGCPTLSKNAKSLPGKSSSYAPKRVRYLRRGTFAAPSGDKEWRVPYTYLNVTYVAKSPSPTFRVIDLVLDFVNPAA